MKILKTIDDDIKQCEMWAHYWMTMASTGVGKKRDLYNGKGRELTDEEKIADCMAIVSNHLHRMSELIDKKKHLIHQEEISWR
jgi:hypothetical protein